MKKHRSLISTLLIVTMLASSVIVGNIYAGDEEKYFESFDFSELAEANPQIPVSDYDIVAFVELSYPAIRLSELDKLEKDERRAIVSDYYKGKNESLAPEVEIGYVSCSYVAPYIEIDYDSVTEYAAERDILIDYADNAEIGAIRVGLAPRNIVDEEGINTVNSNDEYTLEEVYRDVGITDRNTYNGEGIKVGILEIAHPDSTANFPASTINNYGNNRTSQHTTAVMSLIGGTYGINPNVSFYSVATNYQPKLGPENTTFVDALNWLLITQSVDIINMSALIKSYDDFTNIGGMGYKEEISATNSAHYTNICAYIDYAIETTGCMIVKAAGNWGNSTFSDKAYFQMITKPGMSINTLTVGSVDKLNQITDFSSFVSLEDKILKPELVAPGKDIIIPNISESQSGTSLSAPIVTGIAIKLMQEFSKLRTNPSLLKAVLMAGCTPCVGQTNVISDKTGYGRINYVNSRNYMLNSQYGSWYVESYTGKDEIVYHEKIVIPDNSTRKIIFNRTILAGDTCTGYTGFNQNENCAVIDPEMITYNISISDDNGNSVHSNILWDDTTTYLNVTNQTSYEKIYEITIKTGERLKKKAETISVIHGSNHIHCRDMSYTANDGRTHRANCLCGDPIIEMHTFNSSNVCTKCKMPKGFFS